MIDTNVNAQKTPVLIRCSEKERLTLVNLYKQYEGNEPFIFGDQELAAQPLNSVRTDAPYVADRIYDLKTRYWNEMLTFKGISNLNVQKINKMFGLDIWCEFREDIDGNNLNDADQDPGQEEGEADE